MSASVQMLGPVIALVAWSLVMWVWMYVTRIPAIYAAGMKLDPDAPRGEQMALLPPRVRWKADNYNHLMEQPTLFYAIAIALSVLSVSTWGILALAWAYVALRVVHSLVQALGNRIEIRFALFVLSNIPLFALTVAAAVEFAGRMAGA
ncbi:MAG: MAPEG family protein [Burkholderiales bacterium]|nr:MAPEG family protein [Burkholderiales bacterium]MBZ0251653.1 MAPEG family protein [Burkholderiales bacterium]